VGLIAMFVHLQLDGVFVLHDIIHELHKKKMGGVLFSKLTLKKLMIK
jgi:hypothetical protein